MNTFGQALEETLAALASLLHSTPDLLREAAGACVKSLNAGGKLLICGNGGSASEAQHLAGELVGKYRAPRRPLPALVLPGDMSVLTCIGNDFSFADIFSRPLRAFAKPQDVLIAYSTSGASANIIEALRAARELKVKSILFSGRDGGAARALATYPVIVQHQDTARIQEVHLFLTHALVDAIEAGLNLQQ